MKNNIRYVKFNTPQGIGYACFSIDWERSERWSGVATLLSYKIGVAFCSPKDSFIKERGRSIAANRSSGRKNITGTIPSAETGFITDADFVLILDEVMPTCAPGWAKRAFNRKRFSTGLGIGQAERLRKSQVEHGICA